MMTGALPFDGESMGEVLVKQVTQLPPAPRGFNPNDPAERRADPAALPREAARRAVPDDDRAARGAARSRELPARSPPMAPARSLAPGEAKVDAKTVMAYAAQQQKTRIGLAAELPLVSPPSLPGEPRNATMIGDGSLIPPRDDRRAGHGGAGAAQDEHDADRDAARLLVAAAAAGVADRARWSRCSSGSAAVAFAVAWFGRKRPSRRRAGTARDAAVASGGGRARDAAIGEAITRTCALAIGRRQPAMRRGRRGAGGRSMRASRPRGADGRIDDRQRAVGRRRLSVRTTGCSARRRSSSTWPIAKPPCVRLARRLQADDRARSAATPATASKFEQLGGHRQHASIHGRRSSALPHRSSAGPLAAAGAGSGSGNRRRRDAPHDRATSRRRADAYRLG